MIQFEERCKNNPQAVIDDLLAQTKRQAKRIHELNIDFEALKEVSAELQKHDVVIAKDYVITRMKGATHILEKSHIDRIIGLSKGCVIYLKRKRINGGTDFYATHVAFADTLDEARAVLFKGDE